MRPARLTARRRAEDPGRPDRVPASGGDPAQPRGAPRSAAGAAVPGRRRAAARATPRRRASAPRSARCSRTVDWPAKVEQKYAERNLGLEANVELGLDWVFSQVDRAIVLEDDCIPDPTFFRFCDELLERYADDPRVWQIGGDTHLVPPEMFGGDSYAFSTWASVWGWATWADRWHAHRAEFDRDHAGAEERVGQLPAHRGRAPHAARRTAPGVPGHRSRAQALHVRLHRARRRPLRLGPPLVGHDHVPARGCR